MSTLDRLREQKREQEDFIAHLMEQAEAENRDLVEAELANVKAAEERLAQIEAQAEPLVAWEKRKASSAIVDSVTSSAPRRQSTPEVVAEHRSIGQQWAESEQFAGYQARGFRGTSDSLFIADYDALQTRAAGDPIVTNADPGQKYMPQPQKFIRDAVLVPHPLLSLVTPVQVSSNAVDFLIVGEATGADVVAEGAKKPAITWVETTATFKIDTIAGWKKYTRQAAEDIPQLVSIIDQKIRRAIDNKLDALCTAVVLGAKAAGNTTTGVSKAPLLEVIRAAMGELQARNYGAQAVLMNPADYAALDVLLLQKTLNGAVINGTVFGANIIPVTGVTAGTAIVGDVSEAVAYFNKPGLRMYTTDSDVSEGATAGDATSDFQRNILTTLGEVRGKFGVVDASALQFAVSTP